MSKLIENEKLMQEWNYEKNDELGFDPRQLTLGSDKKVWWLCEKGHSYQASISNRNLLNRGCPYCSNNKVLKGYNDMATTHPDMASEFDLEKNYPLTPYDILGSSNKKYWWKCSSGHSWETSANSKKGCPYCSGRFAIKGENDLATTNPNVLKYWDYSKNTISPTDVKEKSNIQVWWLCEKGHSYKKSISEQTRGYETQCPYCANKKILVGFNDLAHEFPNALEEWDYEKNIIKPTEVIGTTQRKVWWKCTNGHSYEMSIFNKTVMHRNCQYCVNQAVLPGFNDIFTTHPYLKEEWDYEKNIGIDPTSIIGGNDIKYWWKCSKGHSWQADVNGRKNGTNCPICSSELHTSFGEQAVLFYISKYIKAVNRYIELGKEIDIFIPNLNIGIEYNGLFYHKDKEHKDAEKIEFFKDKGIRIISICEGEENFVENDIITYCVKKQKNNNLNWAIEEVIKLLGFELINIDVLKDNVFIHQQYVSLEKEQSVGILYPHLIQEWDENKNFPLTPYNMRYGSNVKVWWICSKGHSYSSSISHRVEGKGCPYCQNLKVLEGYNDLGTLRPDLAKEWHPILNANLTPSKVVEHSSKLVWWICKNGHEWQETPHNRHNYGCPYCSGKRPSKDNNLEVKHPNIAVQWDYEKNDKLPSEYLPTSHKEVWWKCFTCGQSYKRKISIRTSQGIGCPNCSNKRKK